MGKNITYKGITKNLKYYKGLKWNKPLTPEMKKFQKETGKNAIFRGVVTGTFEYWMYWQDSKKQKEKKTPEGLYSKFGGYTKKDVKKVNLLGNETYIRKSTTNPNSPYEWEHFYNGKWKSTTTLSKQYQEALRKKVKEKKIQKLQKQKTPIIISTSIQGGFNELLTPPKWLSKIPKSKREFPSKLDRSVGKYYYYRTYPEDKKQNAANLKNKLEKDFFKVIIKTDIVTGKKIYRVYKTRHKFTKLQGMKMKDIQKKKKKSSTIKLINPDHEKQITRTHKRYNELKKMKKQELLDIYTIFKGVKVTEDKQMTKQELIFNILYREAGTVKYGRWYNKKIRGKIK